MHLLSSFLDLSYVQLEAEHFQISFACSPTCTARTGSNKKEQAVYDVNNTQNLGSFKNTCIFGCFLGRLSLLTRHMQQRFNHSLMAHLVILKQIYLLTVVFRLCS